MFCMEVIEMRQEDIKEKVREGYARRARGGVLLRGREFGAGYQPES